MARFLVIEDNAANMELLRYLLSKAGHGVMCAANGAAALEAMQRDVPDLILCDLRMPRMDGYEFLDQLRRDERLRELIVIAVTAYSMPGDSERAMAAGFHGYITKPLDPLTVVATIEGFLVDASPRD